MGITRTFSINLLVCFWNFYQKRTFRMEKKQMQLFKKNHEVSIPQNKARSVTWELSKLWLCISYIYSWQKTDGWIFFALKKKHVPLTWDWYTDKEVFRVWKKVSDLICHQNEWFFRSSSMKGIIHMHAHTHALYVYIYIFVNYALRIGMSTHQYQLVSISKLCAGLASSGVIGPYQTQATRHWRWHKVLESCAKRQRMTSCCGLKRWVYYGWPGHRRSGWEWQGGHRGDPRTLKMVW